MNDRIEKARIARAKKIVAYLKRTYPDPKSELRYKTPFQFLVAVILSAQCTDKKVNDCTHSLFNKYKTQKDFARLDQKSFAKELSSLTFYNNKAKHIIAAAKQIVSEYGGKIPNSAQKLQKLPGIGYKTAHVILGELYGIHEGIATDTHVKRFAKRFELTDHDTLEKISKDLEEIIIKKDWKYVNNGLVLYGRYICTARPHDCSKHPLTKLYPKAANIWPKTR